MTITSLSTVPQIAINDIGSEEDFLAAIDKTIKYFNDGDIVEGTIVKVDRDEVLLDIGYKTEGVIPSRELSIKHDVDPNEVVSVGDLIEALVLQKEDKDGRLILSKKRAQYERAWGTIEKIKEEDGIVTGTVIEVVKGGLILDIGLRGFLPASLVEMRRVRDLQPYVGRELEAKIIELGADTVAAFIGEPIQGAGGVIIPPSTYWPEIQRICDRYGILLVSDEVITGFGRTGNTWGCQTYDFVPDAIISSKNLTAGFFPMGAVILGPELSDRLDAAITPIEEFPHGFTASGHPVGCAIALKAIDVVMNEGLAQNVIDKAPRMEAGLRDIMQRHANIGELRGVGYMWALEAVKDADTKEPFPGTLSVSERIANTCTDMGLICRPLGQSIVLCPPFILTDAQMDEMLEKLDGALTKVFAEVR